MNQPVMKISSTTAAVRTAPAPQQQGNIDAEINRVLGIYDNDATQRTLNLLLRGVKGIGKTQLIAETARYPVLIHSFDPGGTKHLDKERAEGKVLVDSSFEVEDARKPTAYNAWEAVFDAYRQRNYFDRFGTYMIDGLTFWLDAAYNKVATMVSSKGTPLATDGQLEIKGWGVLLRMMQYMIKIACSLPCDFVLAAHSRKTQDESSGMMLEGLSCPPSLQIPVPALFDEYYMLIADPTGTKQTNGMPERVLLTGNTQYQIAGTRIGRGKFDLYEKPNIKGLLAKAGKLTADKPLIQLTK